MKRKRITIINIFIDDKGNKINKNANILSFGLIN